MFFFNPSSNPLLAFLQGGTTNNLPGGGYPAPPSSIQAYQEQLNRQMQSMAQRMSVEQIQAMQNAQSLWNPPQVERANVIAQTPFVGPREPSKVALEQFQGQKAIDSGKPPIKDVTPEFECAQCGHPGPKDRLRGCQVCGGMVWK